MMRKSKRFPALALVLLAASCTTIGTNTGGSAQTGTASSRWTDSVLASMTLREKAAQIVWPSLFGDYTSGDSPQWRRLTQYIQQEKVGGFTISVGSPIEVAAKLNALQSMSKIPLLFGADLEAGAGFRARGGYFVPNAIDLGGAIVFPPEMAIGATRDTTLAYEQGRLTALEGRALGIHIAYAPVLDVNNNPDNPVINTRSYGEDPQLAARMGVAFIHGLQDHGMIATGKHFPGHGDTGVNSHLALPVVTVSRSRLDTVELVPFRAAVNGGVGAIMSFHGAMPALDSSGVPGTLSSKVLTGLLRGEMGFRGIIISDAMDMRGVLDQFGAGEAVKRAIAAADSADVTIVSSYVGQSWDALTASAPQAFMDFVQTLVRRGRKPIVVAFGNPYLLHQLPWVGTYLVAWGGFPVSQTAAARALLGTSEISGHLPISIPPYVSRGTGEERAARVP